jgi:aspartate-semialdehyde dehydrogenase
MDSASGEIRTMASLDREAEASHSFVVVAEDVALRSEANVTVIVADVNDNAPTIDNDDADFFIKPDPEVRFAYSGNTTF